MENDLEDSVKQIVGLRLSMPRGGILEIRPSDYIDSDAVGIDDEVEGIIYRIYWNEVPLPWSTKKQSEAMHIALGCQWGAFESLENLERTFKLDFEN